ncbi:hypothetical protein PM030_09525 [Halorubrum ezzemoulense]|uniref:hypothetical protein n=1 Tax=Halorubrum ezzemoulense TaxID=337243 RepID=UPI00232D947C|nr:hypothetical protein [Halorubrum ezzemoulense]MDB2282113.1 hypothetical protein [Halorubrum ezzemoulense]
MSPPRTDESSDEALTDGTSDREARPGYPERGGIDVFDSLLIRQPIAEGETEAVRGLLADWVDGHRGGDARTLLPVDGVTLVTLFLDDGGFGRTGRAGDDAGRGDALLWYVEVADGGADGWGTPDATVRSASPLFETGLADLLTGEATVHAGDRDGHRYVTHVTNPHRRERYANAVGRPLVAPVAGDELPIPVAIVSLALERGIPSALAARAVDLVNWLKRFDRVQSWARDETDTVEAEAMYTESLLLETIGDRQVVHYYMETEDMDRLYEAFYESDDWEARLSERLFRQLLADPAAFLEPPIETDCEVLIHAVDPERP